MAYERRVAINMWWADDPAERFWMEITNREDLGGDLKAPQVDDSGRPHWTYNLVQYVRDGDTVLHWQKRRDSSGIVGYSIAAGACYASTIEWKSRGTYGRERSASGAEPSWMCDLAEYRLLDAPVTQDEIRHIEPELRAVYASLRRAYRGPLYFPFAFSDRRPVRTAQGYLVKVPRAVIDVMPQLTRVPRPRAVLPVAAPAPSPRLTSRGRAGYVADPALRRALENHAVARAVEYYMRLGYDQFEDVSTTHPFDVIARSPTDVRHVEVKGSSGVEVEHVEVTRGEVLHSRETPTDLAVVDSITWWRDGLGEIETAGGRVRVWHGWTAAEAALTPTRYRLALPSGGAVAPE